MRKKFHQFIHIEKGPINSALINFLTGDIYNIENSIIQNFLNCKFIEIEDFVTWADKEGLLIEIEESQWIPQINFEKMSFEIQIALEIENGIDLKKIEEIFYGINITRVICYGNNNQKKIKKIFPSSNIIMKSKKNSNYCMNSIKINGKFPKITLESYKFNMEYNSCWGMKIAITKKGEIRPCIYSNFSIGNIQELDIDEILKRISFYWRLNKNKVKKCNQCEFRFLCFDCREIPKNINNDIFSANTFCKYNPLTGKWTE